MKKRWRLVTFWSVMGFLLLAALIKYFIFQPKFVPKDFIDARQRSFDIAQTIVSTANKSLVDLSHIGQADEEGQIEQALDLVGQALEDNRAARAKAIELSATLDVMAKNLSEISPSRARDLAAEGLGYEVNLINHLLTHNDYLNQLFEFLKEKFQGRPVTDAQIKSWLNLINQEGETISMLNKNFNDTMLQFDKLTSSK